MLSMIKGITTSDKIKALSKEQVLINQSEFIVSKIQMLAINKSAHA